MTEEHWRGEVARNYRHELEAFIWILAFVLQAYQDMEFQRGTLVEKRMTSDYNNCRVQKNDFRALNGLPDHGRRCRADFTQHRPLSKRLLEWLSRLEIYIYDADINLLTE